MPRAEARARRDGPDQRLDHGAVRAHARGRPSRSSSCSPQNGLERGEDGLKVIMMCELPTNALLAEQLPRALRWHVDRLERHDAAHARASIAIRRSSRDLFDERDDAVKALLHMAITACRKAGQVHRHLRPGAVGSSGPRALADRPGHREHVAQPGHGRRDLAVHRRTENRLTGRRGALRIQPMRWRPASACASVPPSTYSSSPPTGTPCAMRDAREPARATTLGEEVRGRLAFDGRVRREDHLLRPRPRAAAPRALDTDLGRTDAVERRQVTHQHEVAAAVARRTARWRPRRRATRRRRAALRSRRELAQIGHSSPSANMRQRWQWPTTLRSPSEATRRARGRRRGRARADETPCAAPISVRRRAGSAAPRSAGASEGGYSIGQPSERQLHARAAAACRP